MPVDRIVNYGTQNLPTLIAFFLFYFWVFGDFASIGFEGVGDPAGEGADILGSGIFGVSDCSLDVFDW